MNISGQLDVIDLTTLARVKNLTPASVADTSMDSAMSQWISDISARIGRFIGWHLSSATRTEVYELAKNRNVLRLDAKPLVGVTSIKSNPYEPSDWSTVAAFGTTTYTVNKAGGWIRFHRQLADEPNYVQVVYEGGFGAATANIISDFPELAQACELQVKYLSERLSSIAGNVTTIPGAATQYSREYSLLAEVQRILEQHRRGRA